MYAAGTGARIRTGTDYHRDLKNKCMGESRLSRVCVRVET